MSLPVLYLFAMMGLLVYAIVMRSLQMFMFLPCCLIYQYDYALEEIRVAGGGAQPENDPSDFLLGFGIRWYGESGMTASFEYNTVLDRDDFDSDTFSFYLRADF